MADYTRLISTLFCVTSLFLQYAYTYEEDGESGGFKIEGRVSIPSEQNNENWRTLTRILLDGGEIKAFLKEDGSFVVPDVPSGSYILEVNHPSYSFEPVRVDLTSKGKVRARKLNLLQPGAVQQLPYPLRFKPQGAIRYFTRREQWRITDLLFSPMVLMMLLPLFLIVVLPRMMNDPETRKEMESVTLPKYEMPEVSEVLTSFFGGDAGKKQKPKSIATKRRAN